MKIQSPAFTHQEKIPTKYTCDGEDMNPSLFFLEVPKEAKSLILILDDPDAPVGLWTHWIVYNIPPSTTQIAESTTLPGIQGLNTSNEAKYQGPCPPSGTHRYFFRLFALDIMLASNPLNREKIDQAMKDHIIEEAELMGTYSRS